MSWIWRSCSSPHGPRNPLPPIFTPSTKERINPTAEVKVGGIALADVKARRSTAIGQGVHGGKGGRTVIGVPDREPVATGQVGHEHLKAVRSDGGGRGGETVRIGAANAVSGDHLLLRCPM